MHHWAKFVRRPAGGYVTWVCRGKFLGYTHIYPVLRLTTLNVIYSRFEPSLSICVLFHFTNIGDRVSIFLGTFVLDNPGSSKVHGKSPIDLNEPGFVQFEDNCHSFRNAPI